MAGSPRQADYAWTILMRLLSFARARGLTLYRPPERIERLYHADRSEKIWEETHLAAFLAVASEPLQRALMLALETGQRQGDLLALPWRV
jgi:integrase